MARRMSLQQALTLGRSGRSRDLARALYYLDGCPVGGWAETQQALSRIQDELPFRAERDFTVGQFVDAAYTVDDADRYRTIVTPTAR